MSKKSPETPPTDSFLHLDAFQVLKTVKALRERIDQRFPESGLNKVCGELVSVCSRSQERIEWIARPIWPLRIARYVLIALMLAGIVVMIVGVSSAIVTENIKFVESVQIIEAGLNEVVMMGFGLLFVWTFESRVKRGRALRALHELRSIAHVIDMHQLTKDPDRLDPDRENTEASPKLGMDAFNLRRYLDYCSEMLSLVSKVAALHLQTLDDSGVVAAVNEIEELTTGLSRKIWQKIDMLRGEG